MTRAGSALTFSPRRKKNKVGTLVLTRGKLVLTENEVGTLVLIRGELVLTENGVRALVLTRENWFYSSLQIKMKIGR